MRPLIVPCLFLLLNCGVGAASPTVHLTAGTLQGATCSNNTNAVSYKSIPFAEPPVGALRFALPVPYSRKYPGGTLDATQTAPSCIQFDPVFAEGGILSEDCLYLDVWTPANATESSGLPVRVWLFGGGDTSGGISDPLYDGCAVASTGAILVSINYRLGPLGFLALPEAGYTGNQGIADTLLGLQWVQDNIAAFGGDPKKVLLSGESAGAENSFVIATLEQAPKLFSSAVYESGSGTAINTLESVQNISTSFAQGLNCSTSDKSCLEGVSVQAINATYVNVTAEFASLFTGPDTPAFVPCVDGKVVPVQPTEQGVRVPSVFGTNLNEGTLFILLSFLADPSALSNVTAADYTAYLQDNFGNNASEIEAQYPLSAFNSTPFPPIYAMSAVLTAATYRCPARRGLEGAVKNGVPAWTYRFAHSPSCAWSPKIPPFAVALLGPTHSSEIPFVFGETSGLPGPSGTCVMTDVEKNISASMVAAWNSMAERQQPTVNDADWPQWGNATVSLGVNIVNASLPGFVDYTECALWDKING